MREHFYLMEQRHLKAKKKKEKKVRKKNTK